MKIKWTKVAVFILRVLLIAAIVGLCGGWGMPLWKYLVLGVLLYGISATDRLNP